MKILLILGAILAVAATQAPSQTTNTNMKEERDRRGVIPQAPISAVPLPFGYPFYPGHGYGGYGPYGGYHHPGLGPYGFPYPLGGYHHGAHFAPYVAPAPAKVNEKQFYKRQSTEE